MAHAETRGQRNKNPGNVRPTYGDFTKWAGGIGVDGEGYLIFEREIDGLRAMVVCLKAYQRKKGIRSIHGIVKRWTSLKDHKSDKKYIETVCKLVGVKEWTKLNLYDPITLEKVCRALEYYEQGKQIVSEIDYRKVFPHNRPIKATTARRQ